MTEVTKSCRDINELSAVAKKACTLFLEECKKAGIDIFITETYRSQARQNYLYAQGRTRPGIKVTWTLSSNHTGRMAWDIAVNPPKDLYDAATLTKAGAIAKKLGIEWGGTWAAKNLDRPHFEVDKNWKDPTDKKTESVKETTIKPTVESNVTPKPIVPYPGIVLYEGQKGMKKIDIQRIQRATGMKEKDVSGKFDAATTKAVKAYQKKQGLTADGEVGKKTWNRMF